VLSCTSILTVTAAASTSADTTRRRFVQLGLLSVIPLTVLYALEAGVLTAVVRMLRMMLTLGPIFFMLEIETKVRHGGGGLRERVIRVVLNACAG
jgi:predicted membrane channel-forming protein YqfA (hemolysin III family)